jgi:hypothetical protein
LESSDEEKDNDDDDNNNSTNNKSKNKRRHAHENGDATHSSMEDEFVNISPFSLMSRYYYNHFLLSFKISLSFDKINRAQFKMALTLF